MAQRFVLTAALRLQAPTNVTQVVNNIRSQLQNITATVNVQVPKNQQRQLQQVQKSIKNVNKNAVQATNTMTKFGEQAALAGKRFFAFTVATSVFLKLVGAIKNGVSEAISFERELVKISQVTGQTFEGLASLTNQIAKLSTTLGVSSAKLLEVSRILSQSGLSAKDTTTALEALAKSDLAPTFDDIVKTGEGSIAIFRQFGIEAGQLESKLGSINAVAGQFAVESSDIIAAVRRTGGAFSAAGGSLEELIALFTSVRSTTRESAESIATGFRTIFTRLQRVRTQNFLESLGIDLRDLNNQFVGPLEAIRRLSIALKDLPGTDPRFAQIIEELGGFRQVSKVIPLIQQFETAQKALNVATLGTSSLSSDAAKAQQSLAVQIQKTREEFAALLRKIAGNTVFKSFVDITLKLANAFIRVADAMEPLLPFLTVIGSVGLGRAFGSFSKGFFGKGALGFNTGGLVPGSGHGDTVPAMLEPGEFVIRKKAVQAIGAEKLSSFNRGGRVRFAEGGDVPTTFGAVYAGGNTLPDGGQSSRTTVVTPESISTKGNKNASEVKYTGKDVTMKIIDAAISKEHRDKLEEKTIPIINNIIDTVAAQLVPNKPLVNKEFIPNREGILGGIFEGAILRLGPPFDQKVGDEDQQRGFDFPKGLGPIGQDVFGRSDLSSIPVDAKLSYNKDARESIRKKIRNYIAENPEAYGFKLQTPKEKRSKKDTEKDIATKLDKTNIKINTKKQDVIKSKPSGTELDKYDIGDLIGTQSFNAETLVAAIISGDAGGLEKFIVAAPRSVKGPDGKLVHTKIEAGEKIYGETHGRGPKFFRRAAGGTISSGGAVPALLTPGEFVFNKETAKRLGPSKLFKLNNADRFARGGKVKDPITLPEMQNIRSQAFKYLEVGRGTPSSSASAEGTKSLSLLNNLTQNPDLFNEVSQYIPTQSKYLGVGAYGVALRSPEQDVIRMESGSVKRKTLPAETGIKFAAPTSSNFVGGVTIERLPFMESILDKRERGAMSQKEVYSRLDMVDKDLATFGLRGWDVAARNIGVNQQSENVIIDPDVFREGMQRATPKPSEIPQIEKISVSTDTKTLKGKVKDLNSKFLSYRLKYAMPNIDTFTEGDIYNYIHDNQDVEDFKKIMEERRLSILALRRKVGMLKMSDGGFPRKPSFGFLDYGIGDIRRRRRRALDEESELTPQAKELARRRNQRFAQRRGGKKVARVFDFDDTLGSVATGIKLGFKDFSGTAGAASIQASNPTMYTDLARQAAEAGEDVFVLTARALDNLSIKAMQKFAQRAGINLPRKRIIGTGNNPEFEGMRVPGKRPGITRKPKTADKKAIILSKLAQQYDDVVFYDDNEENILKASEVAGIKTVLAQIKRRMAKGGFVQRFSQGKLVRDFAGMSVEDLHNLHSDFEKFLMFQVELDPTGEITQGRPTKVKGLNARNLDEPYVGVGGPVKLPLLKLKKRKPTKRVTHYEDFARPEAGLTGAAGSKERVQQLQDFMQTVGIKYEISPFDIPRVDDPGATEANLKAIKEELSKRNAPVQQFAKGGAVDSVPAMLSPGEYVLRKKAVDQIGVGTLDQMNRGGSVQKFARGGVVRMANGGGFDTVTKGGLALAIVPQILGQFQGLNQTLGPLINIVTSLGGQFVILRGFVNAIGGQFNKFNKNLVDVNQAQANIDRRRQQLQGTNQEYRLFKQRQQANQVFTKEDTERFDLLKQERRQLVDANKADARKIKTTQKVESALSGVAFGAAAVSAALITFGNYLNETGQKLIAAGNDAQGRFRLQAGTGVSYAGSGGITGAGIGATIGTFIAPVIGTAIGGAVGAAIGTVGGGAYGIFSGGREADRLKGIREFNLSVESFDRSVKRFGEQKIPFEVQQGRISAFTRTTRERLLTSKSSEVTDTRELAKKSLGGYQTIFDASAKKAAASFSEAGDSADFFARFLEIAGRENVLFYTSLANIPFSEFKQGIEDQINSYNKAEKAFGVRTKVSNREKDIINLTRAMNEAALSTRNFTSAMDRLVSFAEGTTITTSFTDPTKVISDRDKLFNADEFNRVVAREIGTNPIFDVGLGRNIGGEISNEAQAANKAIRDLPNILLRMRESRGVFEGTGIVDDIVDALGDVPPYIRDAVRNAANNIIGDEGKEQKLLDRIRSDLSGVTKELSSGFDPLFGVISEITSKMAEETNRQAAILAQYTQLEQKRLAQLQTGIDIEEQRIQTEARLTQKPVKISDLRNIEQQRRETTGADTSPFILNVKLITSQNRLLSLQNQLQNSELSKRTELLKRIEEEGRAVAGTVDALKFLGDAGKRTAAAQEELTRVQKAAQIRYDLAEKITFAQSPKEITDLGRVLQGVQNLVASRDISTVVPEIRGDVLSLLKQFGNEFTDPFLGGATGQEVIQDTIVRQLQKLSGGRIDEKLAKEIARVTTTTEEDKLIKEIRDAFATAKDANKYLVTNIERQQDRLLSGLEQSFNKFLNDLKTTLLEQEKLKAETGKTGAEGRVERLTQAKSAVFNIKDFFDLNTEEDVFKVKNNYEEIIRYTELLYGIQAERARETYRELSTLSEGGYDRVRIGESRILQPLQQYMRVARSQNDSAGMMNSTEFAQIVAQISNQFDDENISSEFRRLVEVTRGSLFRGGAEEITSIKAYNSAIKPALLQLLPELSKSFIAESDVGLQSLLDDLKGTGFDLQDMFLLSNYASPETLFENLSGFDSFGQLEASLNTANTQLTDFGNQLDLVTAKLKAIETPPAAEAGVPVKSLFDKIKGLFGFASGGVVPGTGTGDKIPAMLTPGEFVMNKNAVSKIGLEKLYAMNGGRVPKMALGGLLTIGTGGLLGFNIADIIKRENIRIKADKEQKIRQGQELLSFLQNPIQYMQDAKRDQLVSKIAVMGSVISMTSLPGISTEITDKEQRIKELRKAAEVRFGKAYAKKLTPEQLEKQAKAKEKRLGGKDPLKERQTKLEKMYGGKEALEARRAKNKKMLDDRRAAAIDRKKETIGDKPYSELPLEERRKRTELNVIRHKLMSGEKFELSKKHKDLGITTEDIEKQKREIEAKENAKLTFNKGIQKNIDRNTKLTYTARQLLNRELTPDDIKDSSRFSFTVDEIKKIELRKRALRDRRGRQTPQAQMQETARINRIEALAIMMSKGEEISKADRDFINKLNRSEKDLGNFLFRQNRPGFRAGGKVTSLDDINALLDKKIKTRPLQIGKKPEQPFTGMGTYENLSLVTQDSINKTLVTQDSINKTIDESNKLIKSVEAQTGVEHGTIAKDFNRNVAYEADLIKAESNQRQEAKIKEILKKSAETRLKDQANIQYKTIMEQNKTGLDVGYGPGQVAPEDINKVKAMSKTATGFFEFGSKEAEIAKKLYESGTISRQQYANVQADLASQQKSVDYANVRDRDSNQLGFVPGLIQVLPTAYDIGKRAANEAINLKHIGLMDFGLGDAAEFVAAGEILGPALGIAGRGLKVTGKGAKFIANTRAGETGIKFGKSLAESRIGAKTIGYVNTGVQKTTAGIKKVSSATKKAGYAIGDAAERFNLRIASAFSRKGTIPKPLSLQTISKDPTKLSQATKLESTLMPGHAAAAKTIGANPKQLLTKIVDKNIKVAPKQLPVKVLAKLKKQEAKKLVQLITSGDAQKLKPTNVTEIRRQTADFFYKYGIDAKLGPDEIIANEAMFQQAAKSANVANSAALTSGQSMLFSPTKGVSKSMVQHEIAHVIHSQLAKWGDPETMKAFAELTRPIVKRLGKVMTPDSMRYLKQPEELFAYITQHADEMPEYFKATRSLFGFQSGSYIPGAGTGDKVPALLEPGEFVLNRNAVSAVGADKLDSINKKYARFQTGGQVNRRHMQEGGMIEGGGLISINPESLSSLNTAMQTFGTNVEKLVEGINNLNGVSIQLQATHTVEVVINGAQVLQNIKPEIAQLVEGETKKAINSMLKQKFPSVGQVD